MKLKIIKSPNYTKKSRNLKKIKFIIIHYTGMQSKRVSISKLLSLSSKVSCHYLIDRKGEIIQMVNDNKIAWHAGKSKWKNIKELNKYSIGIELVNKGHRLGYQGFHFRQIKSLTHLCLILKKKYKIKTANILGHSDIAPLRKIDPGEKFPWFQLSKKGLGIWYKKIKNKKFVKNRKKIRNIFFNNLSLIGYRYFSKKNSSTKDRYLIKAFQMRFLPKNVNGIIDQKTLKISHYLAKK
jgi:N-acetylmuramoyl-L-alanine amidase